MDVMDFDGLEPVPIPVRIAGKDYTLREAIADSIIKWRNSVLRTMKPATDGMPGEGYPDTEIKLLSYCLHEGEKPVNETFVRALPNKIFKQLLAKAREINGLDDNDNEESLEARIKDLQSKLDKLKEAKAAGKG